MNPHGPPEGRIPLGGARRDPNEPVHIATDVAEPGRGAGRICSLPWRRWSATKASPRSTPWAALLAQEVRSQLDVPPADNTSMDGYALRVADVPEAGTVLPVAQRVPAGVVGATLAPGTACAHLHRRAESPPGADAVVMQEQCEAVAGQGLGQVRVQVRPSPGQWIRRRGEDVQQGQRGAGRRHAAGRGRAGGWRPRWGPACWTWRAGRAWPCSPPAMNWLMPGEPLKPGRHLQLQPLPAARPAASAGLRGAGPGHRAGPPGRHARRAAPRRRRLRLDPHLRCACPWAKKTICASPCRPRDGWDLWQIAIKPGKPLAFGTGAPGGRLGGVVHGAAGQPRVQLRHVPAARAPGAAAAAGRHDAGAASAGPARRFQLAPSPTAAASSCACGSMHKAAWTCSPTRVPAC